MPVPKQRHTKSRRNRRRSHHALIKRFFSLCPKCGQQVLPHQLCQNCGTYAGHQIIDVLSKLTKKQRKKKEKELAGQAAQEKEPAPEKGLSIEELSKK